MQQTVDLNSKGVAFLADHEDVKALACFKEALRLMSEACNGSDVANRTVQSQKGVETYQIPVELTGPIATSTSVMEPRYSQMFLLTREGEKDYETYSLYSAILIFHYGLALHRRGDEVSLHRASLLYQHCLELLSAISDCFECDLIAVEALGNMADIRHKQEDLPGLKSVMDALFLLHLRNTLSTEECHDGAQSSYRTAPAA